MRQEQRTRTDQQMSSIERRYEDQRRESSRQTFEPDRLDYPEHQESDPTSAKYKETLTLSGTLSAVNSQPHAPPGV